jgi:hypothetical protein
MPPAYVFDPDKVAYYERAGWEAYYDRNWPRTLWLMLKLNREQFHLSWPLAVAAALDTVRAAVAFAPLDNDLAATRRHLARFYDKARRGVGIPADAATLADLELDYWVVHRRLALRRKQTPADDDIEPMVASLARLHAALFDASPEAMRPSAEWRGLAAKTVDDITSQRSTDVAADWQRIEDYLRRAYRAVRAARQEAALP